MAKISRREICMTVFPAMVLSFIPNFSSHAQRVIHSSNGQFRALGSLGNMRSKISYHMVAGLSADGLLAVGQSELDDKALAFVWTELEGMVPLSENNSIAWAVSGDGSKIVGRVDIRGGAYASIWSTESGVSFSAPMETWSGIIEEHIFNEGAISQSSHFGEFNAISPDGAVLAGQTDSPMGRHAFWVDTTIGMNDLSFSEKLIERGPESAIYAVTNSLDGHRFAASGTFGDKREDGHCLILSESKEIACNTMQSLEKAEKSIDCAIAQLQTPGNEGKIVSVGGTGTLKTKREYVPVLRIIDSIAEDSYGTVAKVLGALPGGDNAGIANVISQNGKIIAGNASIGEYKKKEWRPFIWDEKNGMRNLQKLAIEEFGLELEDWDLRSATAISKDGSTIGGWGYDPSGQPEPWIMTLK